LLVLLGLPGLYAAEHGTMRRLGLVGFVVAFSGTYLIAGTGNFGFLAPVLARHSPAVLDAITEYPPVLVSTGWPPSRFMVGYALFGVAMTRISGLRLTGFLVAVAGRRTCLASAWLSWYRRHCCRSLSLGRSV
jgi:hypothetical protein